MEAHAAHCRTADLIITWDLRIERKEKEGARKANGVDKPKEIII